MHFEIALTSGFFTIADKSTSNVMDSPSHGSELTPQKSMASSFSTTHWSVVLAAGEADSAAGMEALERLCQVYWYPLYGYVRRMGYTPHDAQDLTQEFFARFLEKRYVSLADRNRGRFRSFLLTSLQHFLVNEWSKTRTARRGGDRKVVSWDEQDAESRYLAEPSDDLAPDRIFDKRWAARVLEEALCRLRDEYDAAGRHELFEELKRYAWGERSGITYQETGARLGLSEGAVKVAVHRLRQRYRGLLREQVAQTVANPVEIDEELRYLRSMFSS